MIEIYSFGLLHVRTRPLPEFVATFDLRERLRDPHTDPALRELTGLDRKIADKVLATPGAQALISAIAGVAVRMTLPTMPTPIGIACAGGRHRSVVIANEVHDLLAEIGEKVSVLHLDVTRPVVQRPNQVLL
jgi:UPF0042 nucleotide-binding protein